MKQIYQVNDKISIWADSLNYIIRIALNKKKKESKQKYKSSYFPTISMCFEDIYETILKKELTKEVQKDIDSIKAVHKRTKDAVVCAVRESCGGQKGD